MWFLEKWRLWGNTMVIVFFSSTIVVVWHDSDGLLGALIGSPLISLHSTSSGTMLFLLFRIIVEVEDVDDDEDRSSRPDAVFIEIAGKHSSSMSGNRNAVLRFNWATQIVQILWFHRLFRHNMWQVLFERTRDYVCTILNRRDMRARNEISSKLIARKAIICYWYTITR